MGTDTFDQYFGIYLSATTNHHSSDESITLDAYYKYNMLKSSKK